MLRLELLENAVDATTSTVRSETDRKKEIWA